MQTVMQSFIFCVFVLQSLYEKVLSQDFNQNIVNMSKLFPNLDFNEINIGLQYAGYLPITPTRALYHWYSATQNPEIARYNDTLIIWLNGGPGCSSLEGLFDENGPIFFSEMTPNWTYVGNVNDQAWNKFGNVLYLETPAGTGFSINNDLIPDNDTTAADNNVQALLYFLDFYQITNRTKIYLSGECYAGIFIPFWAYAIHNYNLNLESANDKKKINFGGFLVGNPCTDWLEYGDIESPFYEEYFPAQYTLLHNQQIISDQLYNDTLEACFYRPNNDSCTNYNYIIDNNITNFNYDGDGPWMNCYDVFRVCDIPVQVPDSKLVPPYPPQLPYANETDCCDGTGDMNFWNDKTLWPHLHINASLYSDDFWWQGCNDLPTFTQAPNGSYWIYPLLIDQGYRIGVYSGNTDFLVPTPSTIDWVQRLVQEKQLTPLTSKLPFQIPSERYSPEKPETVIGGSLEIFDYNFKFFIVYGVGHMSVQWNRLAGDYVLNNFLFDEQTALPIKSIQEIK